MLRITSHRRSAPERRTRPYAAVSRHANGRVPKHVAPTSPTTIEPQNCSLKPTHQARQ